MCYIAFASHWVASLVAWADLIFFKWQLSCKESNGVFVNETYWHRHPPMHWHIANEHDEERERECVCVNGKKLIEQIFAVWYFFYDLLHFSSSRFVHALLKRVDYWWRTRYEKGNNPNIILGNEHFFYSFHVPTYNGIVLITLKH